MTEGSDHHHQLLDEVPGGAEELKEGGQARLLLQPRRDRAAQRPARHLDAPRPAVADVLRRLSYMALGFSCTAWASGSARMLIVVADQRALLPGLCDPGRLHGGNWRGQTHSLMSRSVFGVDRLVADLSDGDGHRRSAGSAIQSNVLASMWNGLYGWTPVATIGIVIAVVGITNNVFGFTGISAFARWVAAPVTVLWLSDGWSSKALAATRGHVLQLARARRRPRRRSLVGVTMAISFATYGNEPDVFRYAQASRARRVIPPLAIGLFVGPDPIADGRLDHRRARSTAATSARCLTPRSASRCSAPRFSPSCSPPPPRSRSTTPTTTSRSTPGRTCSGGWSKWRRIYTCLILMVVGGFMAWWVPQSPEQLLPDHRASLPSRSRPSTVIMYTDQLLLPRLLGIRRTLDRVPAWNEAARANWPALVSLVVAILFGSYVNGIFPGQDGSPLGGWGIGTVEAWVLGAALYVGARRPGRSGRPRERILGFPQTAIVSELEPGVPETAETPVATGAR